MLADSPKLGNACDYYCAGPAQIPFPKPRSFYDHLSNKEIQVVRVLHKNMDAHQAVFPA
jgi:toxin ParE1/3/4